MDTEMWMQQECEYNVGKGEGNWKATAFGCVHKQSHIFAAVHIAIPCQQSFNATTSISAIVIPSLHSCHLLPSPLLPPLPVRPIIHSSCTKIAFTCHFNRIFVAVVACKAFSFVFFSDFLFFCFSALLFLLLLLLLLLCTMFCFAAAKQQQNITAIFLLTSEWKRGCSVVGGGELCTGCCCCWRPAACCVFPLFWRIHLECLFPCYCFYTSPPPSLSLSFSVSVSPALSVFALCICIVYL